MADVSHELSYKPAQEPPPEIKRAIYRLVAIVEIFDNEVAEAKRGMLKLSGFQEALILEHLDRHFYGFTAKPSDRELSLGVLSGLMGLLTNEEIEGIGSLIDEFVSQNSGKLSQIYAQYADDDRCSPLLFQPEALLLFERLEKDPYKLQEAWASFMPSGLLESLATIWGRPF